MFGGLKYKKILTNYTIFNDNSTKVPFNKTSSHGGNLENTITFFYHFKKIK